MASWIKAVLISTGFVATAMHLKLIVPVAIAIDLSQVPIISTSFLTRLKPPYLYVITNVIIIVILVSSKFFRNIVSSHDGTKDYEVCYSGDNKFQTEHHQNVHQDSLRRRTVVTEKADFGFVTEASPLIVLKKPEVVAEILLKAAAMLEEEKKCLMMVVKSENKPLAAEKPLVTARIGQKKPVVKTTPAERNAMRALRVAKPKKNETLVDTWKMIMEAKSALPLTSYYKKSEPDTFGHGEETTTQSGVLEKTEKFSDITNSYQSLPVKVKKVKVSRSRDELNKRVEAFIKKCNDERFASMRLDKEVALRALLL